MFGRLSFSPLTAKFRPCSYSCGKSSKCKWRWHAESRKKGQDQVFYCVSGLLCHWGIFVAQHFSSMAARLVLGWVSVCSNHNLTYFFYPWFHRPQGKIYTWLQETPVSWPQAAFKSEPELHDFVYITLVSHARIVVDIKGPSEVVPNDHSPRARIFKKVSSEFDDLHTFFCRFGFGVSE